MKIKLPLLLIVGTILCVSYPAMSAKLLVKHNGTVVYSVNENGEISFVQKVQELSATPAGTQALKLSRSAEKLLWTAGSDRVNIKGRFIDPVTDTANWIMFRNSTSGRRAAVTDEGDIPLGEDDETKLSRVDMYLDAHIIQNDIKNSKVNEYHKFGDGRIEFIKESNVVSENRIFYIKDHLGSTRVTENSDGNVTEFMAYDAYGAIIRDEIMAGIENGSKEKFTGKEYDTSGFIGGGIACGMHLDYFGARYYDPEIGVFTSTDPAEELWNPYSYTSGNPINYIDPSGMLVEGALAGLQLAYHGTMAFDEAIVIGEAVATQAVTQVATQSIARTILTLSVDLLEGMSNLALAMEGSSPYGAVGGAAAARLLGRASEGLKAAEKAMPALKTAVPKALKGYRYVSKEEASIIRGSNGKIPLTDRLGNPKNLFYTNQEFRSSIQAQKNLSLEVKPAFRIEFDLQNAKAGYGGLAEPLYGQPGGGVEFILGESKELFATGIFPLK
jgi:RHS repeat-associated protein